MVLLFLLCEEHEKGFLPFSLVILFEFGGLIVLYSCCDPCDLYLTPAECVVDNQLELRSVVMINNDCTRPESDQQHQHYSK